LFALQKDFNQSFSSGTMMHSIAITKVAGFLGEKCRQSEIYLPLFTVI